MYVTAGDEDEGSFSITKCLRCESATLTTFFGKRGIVFGWSRARHDDDGVRIFTPWRGSHEPDFGLIDACLHGLEPTSFIAMVEREQRESSLKRRLEKERGAL